MYDHKKIEKKWQNYWVENNTFKTENISNKPKFYTLDMFPYPSGAGLHVGHPEGYTANDIVARFKHANGYNVLHPMGWDAFGLPAENYAIKTGTHPKITTAENIATFKKQIQSLGFSYDWSREVDTTDPKYFKWTQWIFLKMFEHGLAYEQDLPINYCPSCMTGLANEEVLSDFTCERCGTKVEKRKIRQWVLAITKYADRLANDVEKLDWPKGIKDMQTNWIGRSEGCEFEILKDEGFRYSRATKADFERILEIRKETGFHIVDFSQEQFFVAKKNNEIAGFIRTHNYGNFTELGSLYVDENFRGDKLGYKLISYAIEHTNASEFYIDCIKELHGYYEKFGFTTLNAPKDFQVEKLKKVWTFYGKKYTEQDILDITIFMTIKKDDAFPKLPSIKVYTTRIDTVFGMTYAVIAPDHPQVMAFIEEDNWVECEEYIDKANSRSDQDRTADNKEKTGVFTGSYVINPFNGESVPLWIGDYVLGSYGTGAVMAVPAHDERDFAFAKKYNLPIKQVIANYNKLTGDSQPREGFPTRCKHCATAIIKHPDEDKYLIEVFNNGEISLLGGGIEDEEIPLNAIIREIEEESGLIDIKEIRQVGIMVGHGFKERKLTNCKDPDYFYYVELKSLKGFQKNMKEDNVEYENVWWTKEEILSKQVKSHHKNMFEIHLAGEKPFCEDGILMNSGDFTMLSSKEARSKLSDFAEKNGFGHKKVHYKLRDWLFSRQRYWGEPIPLIHLAIEDVKKLPHIDDISKATDENLAYILKREPKDGEAACDASTCHGKVRELIIKKKVFSKIYDGIYGKIVCDYNLPLELPEVERYEPAGDGQSPLAGVENFVNVKLADNLSGKRETNTMPQWGGSCWYYLRYMDALNDTMLVDPEVEKYWGSVDSYVGGAEHAVLHLLYARFWHKFLFDIGVVSSDEPFYRLRNQGMILGLSYKDKAGKLIANDLVEVKNGKYINKENGEELTELPAKMSKSLKNVINPDEVVEEYGADTLRLYEMYMGDFKDTKPWDTKAIVGVRRFLDKLDRTFEGSGVTAENDNEAMKLLHKTVKKVGEDIEEYRFNTSISGMMILLNYGIPKDEKYVKEWKETFIQILHPFAPHFAEELWEKLGKKESIFFASWPKYDEKLVVDNTVKIGVQINGKVRGDIEIGIAEEKESVLAKARNNPEVMKWLDGKEIIKEVYVPGKILNIVIK